MTRFADPERCPDCGDAIVARAPSCAGCGLPLHGPVAQRLFSTLSAADRLLLELRASSLPAPPSPAPTASSPRPYVEEGASSPATPRSRPVTGRARTGLSASSVPQILLGLGALCVLVAALVFLAVTWSMLGVAGRTATLAVLTGITAGVAWWMARRALRAAAESIALVSLGLLTLDVFGADRAGWFGALDTETFLVVLGATVAAAGVATSLVSRRLPTGVLATAQSVAGLGATVAAVGLADLDHGRTDADLALTVVVTALAALALHRLRLHLAAVLAAATTAVLWLGLLGTGLARVLANATFTELWLEGHAWPVLTAAALVAVPSLLARLVVRIRVAAASAAVAIVTGTILAPALVTPPVTAATLAVLAVLVLAGLAAWFAPHPWGGAALLTQVLASVWTGLVGFHLAAEGAGRLVSMADGLGGPTDRLPAGPLPGLPAPWLLPVCLVALLATAFCVARAGRRADAAVGAVADLCLAGAGLALAVVLAVSLYAPPVWVPVALLLVVSVGFAGWWLRGRSPVALAVVIGFLALTTTVASYAAWLTVAALAVTLSVATVVHLAGTRVLEAQLAGLALTGSAAALCWSIGDLADATPAPTVLFGLMTLTALGTVAHPLLSRWWAYDHSGEARIGLEVGAAAAAVPLIVLGGLLAPAATQATWIAVYLTLAGGAVTATALARSDRRLLGWPGGLLLAAATWVRLYDVGVREPEAYTLPSAAALSLVGLWQLRARPESSTVALLGPGLTLGTVPSLVWALAAPSGGRAVLLGVGCLVLVLVGVRLRWTAPMLWGVVVGGLLVVRLAAPYVGDAVPRWMLIGAAGAVLIATGVTWERRLHEAQLVPSYVGGLR